MDTPLLNQNLCKPLQTLANGPAHPISAVEQQTQQTRAATTRAGADHSKTTTSERPDHNIELAALERRADARMNAHMLTLATISQVKSTSTETQAPDSQAIRIPVSDEGKALTEDPAGDLTRQYEQANKIGQPVKRVTVKLGLVKRADQEITQCRYARKGHTDLGTQDGRLHLARFAITHGVTVAAIAHCIDPDSRKSVNSMRVQIHGYIRELKKYEAKWR